MRRMTMTKSAMTKIALGSRPGILGHGHRFLLLRSHGGSGHLLLPRDSRRPLSLPLSQCLGSHSWASSRATSLIVGPPRPFRLFSTSVMRFMATPDGEGGKRTRPSCGGSGAHSG